jgi:hypothetical protein
MIYNKDLHNAIRKAVRDNNNAAYMQGTVEVDGQNYLIQLTRKKTTGKRAKPMNKTVLPNGKIKYSY